MDHDADISVSVGDGGDRASRSRTQDDRATATTVSRPGHGQRAPAMLDGRMRPRPRSDKGDRQTGS
jgi:hypothetical protein